VTQIHLLIHQDSRERQLAELVRTDAAAVMEGLPEWCVCFLGDVNISLGER
jgi:endonuclease/exonuclease/phosphatase family metal-dependent hydrolase